MSIMSSTAIERAIISMHFQGRSKLFTTGQAKLYSVHYVIKCVGGRYN